MNQRADDGVQRAGDGQRDGDEVQRHREGHVDFDRGHHAPGILRCTSAYPQAARPHLADAQAARDGLRRVFVVAREQNRLYTQTGQGGNCLLQ